MPTSRPSLWTRGAAVCAIAAALANVASPAAAEALLPRPSTFNDLYSAPGAALLGRAVRQTSDGGYVMVGVQTTSQYDVVVVRIDASGSVAWQKVFPIAGQSGDGWAIEQTTTGYIIAGVLDELGTPQVAAMNLDADGNLVWSKTYPTGGSFGALPSGIEQTTDGGYLLSATNYDAGGGLWVLRLDTDGAITWQKSYGLAAGSLHVTPDNGAIAAGYGNCASACEPEVVKLDADGNAVWQHRYPVSSGYAYAESARPTADGGYLVSGGYYVGTGTVANALLMKLDRAGRIVWQRGYIGNPCGAGLSAYDAQPTVGGTLLKIALGCTSPGVAKVDADGNVLWQESTNGGGNLIVATGDFAPTRDGGFIATGSNGSFSVLPRLLALKADRNGKVARCLKLRLPTLGMAVAETPPTAEIASVTIGVQPTSVSAQPLSMTPGDLALGEADGCQQ